MLEVVESVPSNPSEHPSACSILVVDDENASGELVATLLRSQGYGVQLVTDGREALSIIARGRTDLLLVDLMMSRMDGVELCAHVRNDLRDLLLPIVITTSLNDRESRIRAKEAGADDVLVKPIDGLELLVRIDCLLRVRAHLSQLQRERDSLHDELAYARSELGAQQRALRTIQGAADSLRALLERQRLRLEGAKKRWAHVSEARDEMLRFAQITAEIVHGLEHLQGMTASTVVRVTDGEIANDTTTSEAHASSATATK